MCDPFAIAGSSFHMTVTMTSGVQNNSRLPPAAGTFSTLVSDFSPKNYNFIEIILLIDLPTEVKVAVMLW